MQRYVIALYIRLSIEDYKYDSLSIENQHLVLNEYAASMPEALNAEIIEFIDNGYSGTNFERPKVQELIEMVRANKIDCIIVKDFSRFGRNSIETGYFIERVFPLFHTRFISISDDFDSNNFKGDTGGMDVAFKYLISEYYSRDMSVKTKSAKYAKMQRGEYQSKICPYGYRKSADGRMEPDPEAAAVVQLIFQLSAGGMNATAITKELFQRNIPTPGEYKAARGNHTHDISRSRGIWSNSTVLRILEDERYIGSYVMGKRSVLEVGGTRSRLRDKDKWFIIPDHHPAIVEKAVFEQVQASQRRFSLPNKKKRDYPLRGKVFCGCCAHALSRIQQKTVYYLCRHSQADETSRCHNMKIDAAELEQAVFLTLKKQMEAAAPLAPDGTVCLDAAVPERSEYEQQIDALQDRKRLLYEQLFMGEIDPDSYKQEKAACDELLLKTKNAFAVVLAQAKQKQEEQARQDSRQEAARAVFNAEGLTPELTDLLIDRVNVFPDHRI
ncbi:MAG: recombinase family protein, partial [Acutalibacteraceae bacterium]